uniref:Cullin family profile domain-containing protein n=1 Tax=Panagrolaimus sp. ES5 TaxID=591445 RepID=A0AC34G5L7_9BILA
MIKDMDLSNTLMNEYKNINFSAQILTSVNWPITDSRICILPSSVEELFKNFENFYFTKYSGRSLKLNPCFGFADLKATFFKQATDGSSRIQETTKLLTVTTYQMCILMKFNESEIFTFKQLMDDTKISSTDLKRILISLTTDNIKHCKVLNRNGTSNVTNSRKLEIDAAIVRIMKEKQRLSHNFLMTDVTKLLQSRFMPDPSTIKKCIESLIEKDYLKRDENDSKILVYVA